MKGLTEKHWKALGDYTDWLYSYWYIYYAEYDWRWGGCVVGSYYCARADAYHFYYLRTPDPFWDSTDEDFFPDDDDANSEIIYENNKFVWEDD